MRNNTEIIKNFVIKIDKDLPQAAISKRIFLNWIKYHIETRDLVSGIDLVEFYIDAQLKYNDTQAPFEWVLHPIPHGIWTQSSKVFDKAGNSVWVTVCPRRN